MNLSSIVFFIINVSLATGTQNMSVNMIKGVNALRCMLLNGFENFYLLLGALVMAAIQFNQLQEL